MKKVILLMSACFFATSGVAMDYETNTDSDAKHTKTRKDIADAVRTNIQIQTEILEETLTEINDTTIKQSALLEKEFQSLNKSISQYFTTMDERNRQRAIDERKFDALKNNTTSKSSCRILTGLKDGRSILLHKNVKRGNR